MHNLINANALTFGELLPLVGKTIGQGNLPRATQIRRDENEEVFLEGKNGEAEITVYKSGRLIYKKGEYETVSAVDRCGKPTFYLDPSHEEAKNGGKVAECDCRLTMLKGELYLASTVPLEHLIDLPWEQVVGFTCEPRLAHNEEVREGSHEEFSYNNDGNDWDPNQWVPSAEDQYLEEDDEPEMTEHEKMLHFIRNEAKNVLTDKQYQAIDLHYNKEMNQEDVAKEMKISQPMVHKHLQAAYKKMAKAYYAKKN